MGCKLLAWKLECELHKVYPEAEDYKAHGNSIRFNLSARNNPELFLDVINGTTTLARLCRMTTAEMAPSYMKEDRRKFIAEDREQHWLYSEEVRIAMAAEARDRFESLRSQSALLAAPHSSLDSGSLTPLKRKFEYNAASASPVIRQPHIIDQASVNGERPPLPRIIGFHDSDSADLSQSSTSFAGGFVQAPKAALKFTAIFPCFTFSMQTASNVVPKLREAIKTLHERREWEFKMKCPVSEVDTQVWKAGEKSHKPRQTSLVYFEAASSTEVSTFNAFGKHYSTPVGDGRAGFVQFKELGVRIYLVPADLAGPTQLPLLGMFPPPKSGLLAAIIFWPKLLFDDDGVEMGAAQAFYTATKKRRASS